MEEVDQELITEGVRITGRAMIGAGRVAKKLRTGNYIGDEPLKLGPLDSPAIPGVYEGDSLAAHIFKWFDERYGERQNLDLSIGTCLLKFRGDTYLVELPRVYGSAQFIIDPNLTRKYETLSIKKPGVEFQPPKFNILKCIKGLPDSIIRTIRNEEYIQLMEFFITAFNTFDALNRLSETEPLAKSSAYDLSIASKTCSDSKAEYGQARWQSLQGTEKIIKLYIKKKNSTFRRTHNLLGLLEDAYDLGLPRIMTFIVDQIQCDASVRYGEVDVEMKEAIDAQLGAQTVAAHIIESLGLNNYKSNTNITE